MIYFTHFEFENAQWDLRKQQGKLPGVAKGKVILIASFLISEFLLCCGNGSYT